MRLIRVINLYFLLGIIIIIKAAALFDPIRGRRFIEKFVLQDTTPTGSNVFGKIGAIRMRLLRGRTFKMTEFQSSFHVFPIAWFAFRHPFDGCCHSAVAGCFCFRLGDP